VTVGEKNNVTGRSASLSAEYWFDSWQGRLMTFSKAYRPAPEGTQPLTQRLTGLLPRRQSSGGMKRPSKSTWFQSLGRRTEVTPWNLLFHYQYSCISGSFQVTGIRFLSFSFWTQRNCLLKRVHVPLCTVKLITARISSWNFDVFYSGLSSSWGNQILLGLISRRLKRM
jgi:hypothetical protein